MKTINITISFEDDKLNALSFFMSKGGSNPQRELEDNLEKLYEKYVPAEMREYIASRSPAPAKDRVKRPVKPVVPTQTTYLSAHKQQLSTAVQPIPGEKTDKQGVNPRVENGAG